MTSRNDRWPPRKSSVAAWSAGCRGGGFRSGGGGREGETEEEPGDGAPGEGESIGGGPGEGLADPDIEDVICTLDAIIF